MSIEAIPAELRERPQWVVWRLEQRTGKATKVPYVARPPLNRASSGTQRCWRASTTDPSTWRSFPEAAQVARDGEWGGIGYVFSAGDPYVGVDLDELDADALEVMRELDSYSERSVSGRGAHVIVEAALNGHPRNRRGPLEVYEQGRYFVMTGEHIDGTPTSIEKRQAALERVLARFLPKPEISPASPAVPVELDDRDLLEKMFAARNGHDVQALYAGNWEGRYPSQSEADLALCSALAFWTGRDPARIDSLFRSSGLMRDKWARPDYRERTIGNAIAGRTETYTAGREATRGDEDIDWGAPDDHAGVVRRYEFMPIADFLAHPYPEAEPLLGEPGEIFLALGSLLMVYGDDGSGKSTWTIDGIAHLAAGIDWLGIPVPRPVRICVIENEGPPGLFQQKLAAKIESWDGPDFAGNLFAFTGPWGEFSFADPDARAALNAYCEEHRIDLVTANPTLGLGVAASGRPDETQQFVDWLVECGLKSTRAFWLLHHENKAGQISGDWGRHPDTKVQLQQDGNQQRTRLDWAKTRWATLPSENVQKVCLLEWIIETQGYTVTELDTAGASDSELEQRLADFLTEHPTSTTRAVWDGVKGTNSRIRTLLDGDRFDCVEGKRGAKLWFLRTTATASGNDAPTQSGANPHE